MRIAILTLLCAACAARPLDVPYGPDASSFDEAFPNVDGGTELQLIGWPMWGANAAHTNQSLVVGPHDPNTPIIWSSATEGTSLNELVQQPIVGRDGSIYVAFDQNTLGSLISFDATGVVRWASSACTSVDATPAIGDNGVLYVPCTDGGAFTLIALDAASGSALWSLPFAPNALSSVTIASNGNVVFGSVGVTELDSNGNTIWQAGTTVFTEPPAIAPDGTVYAIDVGGTLWGIDANGQSEWSVQSSDFEFAPTLFEANGVVRVVVASDIGVTAFDEAGNELWVYQKAFINEPLASTATQIVVSSATDIAAIDLSGNQLWAQDSNGTAFNPIVDSAGFIYTGLFGVFFVHDATGALVAQLDAVPQLATTPSIGVSGALYVVASDGTVSALAP